MVHVRRLISKSVIATTCALTLLNICSLCRSQQEDISHNLIRDPVELGNPYPLINRGTHPHYYGANMNAVAARKHPNHHRRQPPQDTFSELSSQAASASDEESKLFSADKNAVRGSQTKVDVPSTFTTREESDEECVECTAGRQNARATSGLDDSTLRAVRVEMIKRKILKKLRLTEPPKMEHVPKGHHTVLPPIALGNPVLSNAVRTYNDDNDINTDPEDFYGKTEQIIVLPQDIIPTCNKWGASTHHQAKEAASCFIFDLPKEVRNNQMQINSAELWVYKLSDISAGEKLESEHLDTHTFTVSEFLSVSNPRSTRRRASTQFIEITDRHDVPEISGWINFNITDKARQWLVAESHEHTIKVSCSNCSTVDNESPFLDIGSDQQPFIIFNIANGKPKRRSRRSINCSPGITECCRESLYISFEEISWDWVLKPKGFDAYYCKGKCHGDSALAQTATRHAGIMIDYVKQQGGVNNRTIEIVPCCTATEMKPISLLILNSQSSNTTIQKVMLPNMVIHSCGCK